MLKGVAVLVCVATLALGAGAAWSEGGATDAQVEQLQKQLTAMQEEMAALRKAAESKDIPASTRETMQQHMGQMAGHMDSMHKQCCMMNPGGCPMGGMGMGTPPSTK